MSSGPIPNNQVPELLPAQGSFARYCSTGTEKTYMWTLLLWYNCCLCMVFNCFPSLTTQKKHFYCKVEASTVWLMLV